MSLQDVRLSDRYDLNKSPVLLNGTQALVRLMLNQAARDRAAGLNTAGLVTGYRGSPLGAVDQQMERATRELEAANVVFQYGLNEDLAATALWGSQQAELRGEGRYDGVFGLWYGKGPGVDRSGDVFRHVNMAGTSAHGGVIAAMGDDHTGESSTTLHQSEWTMVDSYMPILSPAGVQEILDFGLFGYALSRYSGLWVGLKCMKDTVEVTSVVDADPLAARFVTPDFTMPPGGLNIRLNDTPHAQEERVIDYRRHAAEAFGRANRFDRRVLGKPGAKVGFVAAGKNWLDLTHALNLLGIDAAEAERLGITTYKVGMTWPLDFESFREWAEGVDLIVIVEEKRKLIEVQAKEAIFNNRQGRRLYGGENDRGETLFQTKMDLDPVTVATKLGHILIDEGRATDAMRDAIERLDEARKADNAQDLAARLPYFCSGCPHNSSTKLPEGARAYAGIGCHYMVQWMDRETVGYTHMGGEGANWIGEAPFSKRDHVFQNLGDGTYNHSGIQAIRAAIAANTNITYKILFNDAVAMTGGQTNEGGLDAYRIVNEVLSFGPSEVVVVYDPKEAFDPAGLPSGVSAYPREDLGQVQERLSRIKGVTVLVYVQTCAAEKRRRRKRGTLPDPESRVFINTDICEGCGDCGVQSNCVSIIPVETEFGRKRAVDQSSCNTDFSCIQGFCPSFVSVEGAVLRKSAGRRIDLPSLPEPTLPAIDGTYNMVITGVGGTGVVTIGASIAMAAHLDSKGVGMMEMAGLAQKGGAVHVHCRLANSPREIDAVRVSVGEAHALIGGDLVVSAGAKTLGLLRSGQTGAVVNSHEAITGDFTRDTGFRLPGQELALALEARLKDDLHLFDASRLARELLGDSIYSNMLLLGAIWQMGRLPLSGEALRQAIRLNGAAVDNNLRAFEIGRWAVLHPRKTREILDSKVVELPATLADRIALRDRHLAAYQGPALVQRYHALLDLCPDDDLRAAVAEGFHKLLTYKDEYEVARLHLETAGKARAEFDGRLRLTYHLAPPLLSRTGPDGRPVKREFGPWMGQVFRLLAALKGLRGTRFDPFGYSAERRMERALIDQYEADMRRAFAQYDPKTAESVIALARLPLSIRGFGPVKARAEARAAKEREALLAAIQAGGTDLPHAAE